MNLKTGILALLALTANTVFAQTNQQKDTIYEFTAQQCIDFGIKTIIK